jgi:hypothetical protein
LKVRKLKVEKVKIERFENRKDYLRIQLNIMKLLIATQMANNSSYWRGTDEGGKLKEAGEAPTGLLISKLCEEK